MTPVLKSDRMTVRHAAALALAGWYLMVPPYSSGRTGIRFDFDAPLINWQLARSFDSAEDCEAFKLEALKVSTEQGIKRSRKITTSVWSVGDCIASDDPRLKEK